MFGLGVWPSLGGSHSACPRNRVRGGCRGADGDGLGDEARRPRGLAGSRGRCGVRSAAQVRLAASHILVEVGRSLTEPAVAIGAIGAPGSGWPRGREQGTRKRAGEIRPFAFCPT
jgi:hypothetical protein